MSQGRLPIEFRDRTKKFVSAIIRLFVTLPKGREEVRILGTFDFYFPFSYFHFKNDD